VIERDDDSYTDFRVHYEDCPRCRPQQTCPIGAAIKQRETDPQPPDAATRAFLASMGESL
jgi:hypothetical protein